MVRDLHDAGIGVVCWTSNDPNEWAALSGTGVDGIITDTPANLRDWQRRSAGGQPADDAECAEGALIRVE